MSEPENNAYAFLNFLKTIIFLFSKSFNILFSFLSEISKQLSKISLDGNKEIFFPNKSIKEIHLVILILQLLLFALHLVKAMSLAQNHLRILR